MNEGMGNKYAFTNFKDKFEGQSGVSGSPLFDEDEKIAVGRTELSIAGYIDQLTAEYEAKKQPLQADQRQTLVEVRAKLSYYLKKFLSYEDDEAKMAEPTIAKNPNQPDRSPELQEKIENRRAIRHAIGRITALINASDEIAAQTVTPVAEAKEIPAQLKAAKELADDLFTDIKPLEENADLIEGGKLDADNPNTSALSAHLGSLLVQIPRMRNDLSEGGITADEQTQLGRFDLATQRAEAVQKRLTDAKETKYRKLAEALLNTTNTEYARLQTAIPLAADQLALRAYERQVTIYETTLNTLIARVTTEIQPAARDIRTSRISELQRLVAEKDAEFVRLAKEAADRVLLAANADVILLVDEFAAMTQTEIEALIPEKGLAYLKDIRSKFEVLSELTIKPDNLDSTLEKLREAIRQGDLLEDYKKMSYHELLSHYLTINKLEGLIPDTIYNILTGEGLKRIQNEQLRKYYLVKVFLYRQEYYGYGGATFTFSTYLKPIITEMEKTNITMGDLAQSVFIDHVIEDDNAPMESLTNVDKFEVNTEAIEIWNYVVKRIKGIDENGDPNVPDPTDPTDFDYNYSNTADDRGKLFRAHLEHKFANAFRTQYTPDQESRRQMFLKTVISYCIDLGSKSVGYVRPLALETTRSHGMPFVGNETQFEDEIGTMHNPIAKAFYDARRYGNDIVSSSIFTVMINMDETMARWNTPPQADIDKMESRYRAETNPTEKEKLRLKWEKMKENRAKDLGEQEENWHLLKEFFEIWYNSVDGNMPQFVKDSRAIFTFDLQKRIRDEADLRRQVLAGTASFDKYRQLLSKGEIVREDAEYGLSLDSMRDKFTAGKTARRDLDAGRITLDQYQQMYLDGKILEEPIRGSSDESLNREINRQLQMGKIDLEGTIVPIQGEIPIEAMKAFEKGKNKLLAKYSAGRMTQDEYQVACKDLYIDIFSKLNASNINLVYERTKRFWDAFREPASGMMTENDIEEKFKEWRSEVLGKMKLIPGKHTLIMGPFTVMYIHLLLSRYVHGKDADAVGILVNKMIHDYESSGGVDGIPDLTEYLIRTFYPNGIIPDPPKEGVIPRWKGKPLRSLGIHTKLLHDNITPYLWHAYEHRKGVRVDYLKKKFTGRPRAADGTELIFHGPWKVGKLTHVASQNTATTSKESEKK